MPLYLVVIATNERKKDFLIEGKMFSFISELKHFVCVVIQLDVFGPTWYPRPTSLTTQEACHVNISRPESLWHMVRHIHTHMQDTRRGMYAWWENSTHMNKWRFQQRENFWKSMKF